VSKRDTANILARGKEKKKKKVKKEKNNM